MNLLLIAIGMLAFGLPHLATPDYLGMVVQNGMLYAGELALVFAALAWTGRLRPRDRYADSWTVAALACCLAAAAFEIACSIIPQGQAGPVVATIEQFLHAVSVSTWLVSLLSYRERAIAKTHLPWTTYALAVTGGALWYLVQAEVADALAKSLPQLALYLGINTLLSALPFVIALVLAALDQKTCTFLALSPFAGALAGNRLWALLKLAGIPQLSVSSLSAAMMVAPILSCGVLLQLWMTGLLPAQGEFNDEPTEDADTPRDASAHVHAPALPLHRIPGYQLLSEREREVVTLALLGKTAKQTAEETGIAPATVRTYRARALSKLGVQDISELIAELHKVVKEPANLSVDSNEQEDASTQAIVERLTPLAGVGCVTACILLLSVCLRLPPQGLVRVLLTFAVFALCAGIGAVFLVREGKKDHVPSENEHSVWLDVLAPLLGIILALVVVALQGAPSAWLLRRILIGAVILALTLWLAYQTCAIEHWLAWRALVSCGLVGATLVPASLLAQAFVRSPWPPLIAMAALVVAAFMRWRVRLDETVSLAAVYLAGDARTLAYLEGRGLSDLQAQAVLLTARNYPLKGIAATLHVSQPTVAQYRSRAYKELGVDGKLQLMELLYREAGLMPLPEEDA